MIMETENSHHLLSLAGDLPLLLQSESKDLRTRAVGGSNPSARAGEDLCHSSVDRPEQRGQIPSSSAFCSMQALNRLDETHPY